MGTRRTAVNFFFFAMSTDDIFKARTGTEMGVTSGRERRRKTKAGEKLSGRVNN